MQVKRRMKEQKRETKIREKEVERDLLVANKKVKINQTF